MTDSEHRFDNIVGLSLDQLRRVVGDRLLRVGYKGSADVRERVGIHEVDQAIILSTDSTTVVLEWRIRSYDEFLSMVDSPDDAATASIDAVDVTAMEPWSSLVGSSIVGIGIATQQSETGRLLLWALRINFEGGGSVAVSLGDLRDAGPNYQPDSLLVISDPEVAQSYQVLGAPESAWGRSLYL
jgi:hypothetical protein